MKTDRTKFIVLVVFVLTLGAGVVAGLLAARLPKIPAALPADPLPVPGDSPLAESLELTAAQRGQMKSIWESVQKRADESFKASENLRSEEDTKIQKLIPPEKIDEYKKIKIETQNSNAAMKGAYDKAFGDAVKQTMQMLNPGQQEKYNEILKKRLGANWSQGHDPMGSL